ncbi:hypothetical protein Peur_066697 [Populus x canadensis]
MIALLCEENKLFCFQPFLFMIAAVLLRSENKLFVNYFWLSRAVILICNCEILFKVNGRKSFWRCFGSQRYTSFPLFSLLCNPFITIVDKDTTI